MNTITSNLQAIQQRIRNACLRAGREQQQVRLIAVSKVKPAALIDQAYRSGQQLFGESYVQEFRDKVTGVQSPVEWHFVGGLQTNKVKYLRGKVAMIHSVDRLSLAQEISRQWQKLDLSCDILLQVNVGCEPQKSGCLPSNLAELATQICALPYVKIKGLMCIPPHCEEAEEVRPYFQQLHELARKIDRMQLSGVRMEELSMGMSSDFEVAVEEGATLVRVGTAIFGERPRKDP